MEFTSEKKSFRFNIFDILILITVLWIILGLFLRPEIEKLFHKAEETLTYTLYAEGLTAEQANAIENGCKIYDSKTGRFLGTLSSIKTAPEISYAVMDDGSLAAGNPENLFTLSATASATGYTTNTGTFLKGDMFITSGSVFRAETETATFDFTVKEIIRTNTTPQS